MTAEIVLKLRGITKRFGRLTANQTISLELRRGEVLGLLGENGAGKSTLMSILFGHYIADEGRIEVFNQSLPPGQPRAALAAGIGMVHQHFALADNLTVLDNILLGTESMLAFVSRRSVAAERISDLAQRFGLAVEPEAKVADLSVGERQRVEILKALYRGAKILILDEPTAVLTPQESIALFGTLRSMLAEGLSIIFISHKLDEVLSISHRIAVLRRGELVAEMPASEANPAQLAEIMVGRKITSPRRELYKPATTPDRGPALRSLGEGGPALLTLSRVNAAPKGSGRGLKNISLQVASGEIVAIAGVAGNGQEVLADLLSGLLMPQSGRVEFKGGLWPGNPRALVQARCGRVPEDRHQDGTIGDLPVWENAVLETYRSERFSRFGFRRKSAAIRHAEKIVGEFDVRLSSVYAAARTLSGGNMQKLILGRVLLESPELVIVNQPTWGLDIGAVSFVHEHLLTARANGAGVLLLSEDLDEIFALADRIGVMHDGQLGEARSAETWTMGSIGLAMTGAKAE